MAAASSAAHIDDTGISKASSLRASDRDAYGPLAPTKGNGVPVSVHLLFLVYWVSFVICSVICKTTHRSVVSWPFSCRMSGIPDIKTFSCVRNVRNRLLYIVVSVKNRTSSKLGDNSALNRRVIRNGVKAGRNLLGKRSFHFGLCGSFRVNIT